MSVTWQKQKQPNTNYYQRRLANLCFRQSPQNKTLPSVRHRERSTAPTHVETPGTRSVAAIMRRVEPEDLERTRCLEGSYSSRATTDCLSGLLFIFLLLSPLLIMEQPRPAVSCTMQSAHTRTHTQKKTCKHIQRNIRCTAAQMQLQIPLRRTSLN